MSVHFNPYAPALPPSSSSIDVTSPLPDPTPLASSLEKSSPPTPSFDAESRAQEALRIAKDNESLMLIWNGKLQSLLSCPASSPTTPEQVRSLISDHADQLGSIRTLDLSGLELETFPVELCEAFPHLHTLLLINNKLVSLPPEMRKLRNLTTLCVAYNQLEKLPALPESLKILDLSHNHLSNLPRLPKLTFLDLSHNQFTEISSTGLPYSLNTVNLSHNSLREFPPSLEKNVMISRLDLSYNKISSLEHFPMTLLTVLRVEGNPLQRVPSFLLNGSLSFIPTPTIRLLSPLSLPSILESISANERDFLLSKCPHLEELLSRDRRTDTEDGIKGAIGEINQEIINSLVDELIEEKLSKVKESEKRDLYHIFRENSQLLYPWSWTKHPSSIKAHRGEILAGLYLLENKISVI